MDKDSKIKQALHGRAQNPGAGQCRCRTRRLRPKREADRRRILGVKIRDDVDRDLVQIFFRNFQREKFRTYLEKAWVRLGRWGEVLAMRTGENAGIMQGKQWIGEWEVGIKG